MERIFILHSHQANCSNLRDNSIGFFFRLTLANSCLHQQIYYLCLEGGLTVMTGMAEKKCFKMVALTAGSKLHLPIQTCTCNEVDKLLSNHALQQISVMLHLMMMISLQTLRWAIQDIYFWWPYVLHLLLLLSLKDLFDWKYDCWQQPSRLRNSCGFKVLSWESMCRISPTMKVEAVKFWSFIRPFQPSHSN